MPPDRGLPHDQPTIFHLHTVSEQYADRTCAVDTVANAAQEYFERFPKDRDRWLALVAIGEYRAAEVEA
jgi:hypothetical protein